jgi:hypothetical protein
VKRSGTDEPMWVAIHKCMEATLEISLYSYLYPKLAKMLCLTYYLLCFLFKRIGEEEGGTGSAGRWGVKVAGREEGEVAQKSTHVNKCKNDKIKKKKSREHGSI